VQHESARASGVSEDQIVIFEQQADAIEALRSGAIDAYASTAVGNRTLAGRIGNSMLEAVEHDTGEGGKQRLPTGAFSFSKTDDRLLKAVNKQLRAYLGTADHRNRMSRFGLTHKEIDPVECAHFAG
jgi:polar amino acid transport system substrate-binding protein